MNLLRTLIITSLVSAASAAEIPAGTHLLLRMEHSVSSRTAKAGDSAFLRTASPILVDGRIAIPVGTPVFGKINSVQRSGRLHGRARLEIGLETLLLPTGSAIDISPTIAVAGTSSAMRRTSYPDRDGRPLVAIGAGMLAGFAAGAVAGKTSKDANTAAGVGLGVGVATGITTAIMMRNRDFEVPEGTTLDVSFDSPVRLD